MKNSEIKVGSTVITPITDGEGQAEYVTGKLVSINSRYAKIDLGDKVINVGKSKIELVDPPKATKKVTKKPTEIKCGGCGTIAEDGDEECSECGEALELEDDEGGRIADEYEYKQAIAASGRTSCDTGDQVADTLRGKTLDEAYAIVAKVIGDTQKALKARYQHLNPGHQRMCIGNRLRGFYAKQEA